MFYVRRGWARVGWARVGMCPVERRVSSPPRLGESVSSKHTSQPVEVYALVESMSLLKDMSVAAF